MTIGESGLPGADWTDGSECEITIQARAEDAANLPSLLSEARKVTKDLLRGGVDFTREVQLCSGAIRVRALFAPKVPR